MELGIIITGFIVGVGVGLTGMGGALIMTPLLILLFGFSPIMAIGTDLIFASITKFFGSVQHFIQRTVHLKLVLYLSVGSIPGGLFGVIALRLLDRTFAQGIEQYLTHILGVLFIGISLVMLYGLLRQKDAIKPKKPAIESKRWAIMLGFFGGFLVGMTSVGSGSLFIAILLIMSSLPAARLVGTDIVHAFILTLATGLLHASFGHVDWRFVFYLIIGSVPGILLGSRMTINVPDWIVRTLLIVVLFLTGLQLTI